MAIKLNDISKEISNLLFSKGLINSMYSNESKQEKKILLENESMTITNEIAYIDTVIKYATHCLFTFVTKNKEHKLNEYRKIIKYFAEVSANNTNLVNII